MFVGIFGIIGNISGILWFSRKLIQKNFHQVGEIKFSSVSAKIRVAKCQFFYTRKKHTHKSVRKGIKRREIFGQAERIAPPHTSYLSGAPGAVPVEKIGHVEKFPHDSLSGGEILQSPHDRLSCGKILHKRNVKKSEMWKNTV